MIGSLGGVIRLSAADAAVVLDDRQVSRIRFLLLEFIPATICEVDRGPAAIITVPNHGLSELAPGIRGQVESTMGCRVEVDELED